MSTMIVAVWSVPGQHFTMLPSGGHTRLVFTLYVHFFGI
jgi:hypothetical protein